MKLCYNINMKYFEDDYRKKIRLKEILVRDLAWKFAVTERTIQHDLRFLEENGFIKTQINKTLKGKRTKNSYIVKKNKEKDLPFENTYLGVCFIVKKDDGIYVLTKTNYKAKELAGINFKPMNDCYFRLPQVKLKLEKRIDENVGMGEQSIVKTNLALLSDKTKKCFNCVN